LVKISRNAEGDLAIHSLTFDRGAALLNKLKNFDEDFVNPLEQNHQEQPAMHY